MAKEFYLNPVEFSKQIDNYNSQNDTIKALKYDTETLGLYLKCVDRYMECVIEFNETIKEFGALSDLDVNSMRLMRGAWMNLDEKRSTEDFMEKSKKDLEDFLENRFK